MGRGQELRSEKGWPEHTRMGDLCMKGTYKGINEEATDAQIITGKRRCKKHSAMITSTFTQVYAHIMYQKFSGGMSTLTTSPNTECATYPRFGQNVRKLLTLED